MNNMPPPRVSEPPTKKKVALEQALTQMLTSHIAFMNETKANMQNQAIQLNNQAAQLRNLEVQMGQMANILIERQQGSLPSNSEKNPRSDGKEHVKAITLRSGRKLATRGPPPITKVVEQFSLEDQRQGEQPQEEKSAKTPDGRKKTKKQAATTELYAPVPYPQCLRQNKLDKQFTKFMEVFKKLHINIPFRRCIRTDAQLRQIHERYTIQEKKDIKI